MTLIALTCLFSGGKWNLRRRCIVLRWDPRCGRPAPHLGHGVRDDDQGQPQDAQKRVPVSTLPPPGQAPGHDLYGQLLHRRLAHQPVSAADGQLLRQHQSLYVTGVCLCVKVSRVPLGPFKSLEIDFSIKGLLSPLIQPMGPFCLSAVLR